MLQKKMLKLATTLLAPASAHGTWKNTPIENFIHQPLSAYQKLIQTAEEGKLDFVFQPDRYAMLASPTDITYKNNLWLEPITLLTALLPCTSRIGLAATASTIYNEPYHIARMFASIDHLSSGRAAWNVVSSRGDFENINFGKTDLLPEEERAAYTEEFLHVVKKLWDSWEDEAVILNKREGIFADATKLHVTNHQGDYFDIQGPLSISRPPQGHPVIIQAGASEHFKERAAETADIIFTMLPTLDIAKTFYKDVKKRLVTYKRQHHELLIMPGAQIIVGNTVEEAYQKKKHYEEQTIHLQAMQSTGRHASFIGTPQTIADEMAQWLHEEGADGFIFIPTVLPEGLDDFVHKVVPVLQQRGLFKKDYMNATLRENLGLLRPRNTHLS